MAEINKNVLMGMMYSSRGQPQWRSWKALWRTPEISS